ncbi:MAG: radical SAM protein [Anaerolineae bacterium]|nr:radical SAM protein [Anaerolineae bacterium]
MRILYGPVDSWRFGRSLGVDPLAARHKLCPLSCTYCQYGRTERPTVRRQVFVSADRLRRDLETIGQVTADWAAFAGLGEPTLAANLPDLVAVVRQTLALPVVVLTGSGLMARPDVHRDLMSFDAVAIKLDAPDETLFSRINRPGSGFPYAFAAIVDGIRHFRSAYAGRLILQCMFVQANKHVASQMADLARSFAVDLVQLNTPLQPALGSPVSAAEMQEIEGAFAGLPVCCVYDGDGQTRIRPRVF